VLAVLVAVAPVVLQQALLLLRLQMELLIQVVGAVVLVCITHQSLLTVLVPMVVQVL
jgi:hypothetical protein